MFNRCVGKGIAVFLSVLCISQSFILTERADATTLLVVIAAGAQANTPPAPTPTPTPDPPRWTPPDIDFDPIGPFKPTPGGFLPFDCEYIDLGHDSGGLVTPVCEWLEVGLGGTMPDDGDFSICVCARVDVIGLVGELFGK